MEEVISGGEQHDVFTVWAQERGVKINAVGPARIRGRGLGIVAKRKIQVHTDTRGYAHCKTKTRFRLVKSLSMCQYLRF